MIIKIKIKKLKKLSKPILISYGQFFYCYPAIERMERIQAFFNYYALLLRDEVLRHYYFIVPDDLSMVHKTIAPMIEDRCSPGVFLNVVSKEREPGYKVSFSKSLSSPPVYVLYFAVIFPVPQIAENIYLPFFGVVYREYTEEWLLAVGYTRQGNENQYYDEV